MLHHLHKYNNWEYSKQVWYDKYHIAISLGYSTRSYPIKIKSPPRSIGRLRNRYTKNGILTDVYTNDIDYAETIINDYLHKVISIRSPINESHLAALRDDRNVEMRNSLYHRKYRFKVHTYKNYKLGYDRFYWESACNKVNDWIHANFSNTKFQKQLDVSVFLFGQPHSSIEFIYTNDEMTLMLYKMAFGDMFNIEITQAFIPEDFASV